VIPKKWIPQAPRVGRETMTDEQNIASALLALKQLDLAQTAVLAQHSRLSEEINLRLKERSGLSNLVLAVTGLAPIAVGWVFSEWKPLHLTDIGALELSIIAPIFLVSAGLYSLIFKGYADHSGHIYAAALYISHHLADKMEEIEKTCCDMNSGLAKQKLVPGLFCWEQFLALKRNKAHFSDSEFESTALRTLYKMMFTFFSVTTAAALWLGLSKLEFTWPIISADASTIVSIVLSVVWIVLAIFLHFYNGLVIKDWEEVKRLIANEADAKSGGIPS
jgi:hypothetical protein